MQGYRTTRQGFTLVELLVAISIFTVVMLIAISSLLSINAANKKTQAIRTVTDSLNFALENMTRSMRLGTDYACVGNVPQGQTCTALRFQAYNPVTQRADAPVVYSVLSGSNQLVRCSGPGGASQCTALTPESVVIRELRFDVSGVPVGDGIQPRVRVFIKGDIDVQEELTTFSIQTVVSQRQYQE